MNVNTFSGNPKTEWLPNGRDMLLLEDFSFADTERIWTAKKGAIINGASIPKLFWGIVGSPFVGLYRDASIIHDYYYQTRTQPKKLVDKMFYQAMLARGTDKDTALKFYLAVKEFGINWDEDGNVVNPANWLEEIDEVDETMVGG